MAIARLVAALSILAYMAMANIATTITRLVAYLSVIVVAMLAVAMPLTSARP